jgi:hypothetical protein
MTNYLRDADFFAAAFLAVFLTGFFAAFLGAAKAGLVR